MTAQWTGYFWADHCPSCGEPFKSSNKDVVKELVEKHRCNQGGEE